MKVNIERAIKSITDKIDFYQPLYEAIVNSFQANATTIKIYLNTKDDYVFSYVVEDDGIGFHTQNLDSFLTLWSDYKVDKFALGSGRILCLKVFDNIIIESQTKDYDTKIGQKVDINFHKNFTANSITDIDDVKVNSISRVKNSSDKSYTVTKFENINEDYKAQYNKEKAFYNLEEIKEKIFIRLLPMFIGFEASNKNFKIMINDSDWLDTENLRKEFQDKKFLNEEFLIKKDMSLYDTSSDTELSSKKDIQIFKFNLKYRIVEDDKNSLEQFYGAADRYINSFSKGVSISKLEKGYSGIFCLTSDYFNTRIKDSRNAFTIGFNQNNTTIENPISFPEIHKELSIVLTKILRSNFKNIDTVMSEKKDKIIQSFPHLARYVDKIDNLTMTQSDMQKNAEKAFFDETRNVRSEVEKFTEKIRKNKNSFNEAVYRDITQHFTIVGREQLADYIGYRQTIIDMLLEIYAETQEDKSRFNEKDIHDLFMPMSETSDTSFKYANNIWMFDDKFMSYIYAASDKTIGKIVKDLEGTEKKDIDADAVNKEPDLVMFYSNPDNEYKDVLLIEFKRLNDGIDSKEKAISQINRYPMYIVDHVKNIRSIFTYTILDIDDEFSKALTRAHGFIENSFGDKDNNISSYYRYNPSLKAHTNVVSFNQILSDANKRNKVFLDILIENFSSQ